MKENFIYEETVEERAGSCTEEQIKQIFENKIKPLTKRSFKKIIWNTILVTNVAICCHILCSHCRQVIFGGQKEKDGDKK